MSLTYSHPKDMYEYAKSVDRKLSTIIELLTLLNENNAKQINPTSGTTINSRFDWDSKTKPQGIRLVMW